MKNIENIVKFDANKYVSGQGGVWVLEPYTTGHYRVNEDGVGIEDVIDPTGIVVGQVHTYGANNNTGRTCFSKFIPWNN